MQKFTLAVQHRSETEYFKVKRKEVEKLKIPEYQVNKFNQNSYFEIAKFMGKWRQAGGFAPRIDKELIEAIGHEIEMEDMELFGDYDESREIKRIFKYDLDAVERFEWIFEDK